MQLWGAGQNFFLWQVPDPVCIRISIVIACTKEKGEGYEVGCSGCGRRPHRQLYG